MNQQDRRAWPSSLQRLVRALGVGLGSLVVGAGLALAAAVVTLHAVPSANVGTGPNSLGALATPAAGNAWAVGFNVRASTSRTLIERNDGHGWTAVPAPSPSGGAVLTGVSGTAANDVWAVGYQFVSGNGKALIEHWNGSKWSVVPSPNHAGSGFLTAVSALSPTDAWAVGSWDDQNGFPNTIVEHWNGTDWTASTTPETPSFINQLQGVDELTSRNVWAVGYGQDPESGTDQALIDHFDGTSWKLIGIAGEFNKSFAAIAATSAKDIWAVGAQFGAAPGGAQGFIEHFDGRWSPVASPRSPGFDLTLTGVAAHSTSDAWAVGYEHGTSTSGPTAIAEHWDGRIWKLVPAVGLGASSSMLNAVAEDPSGQVWAVGSRDSSAGTARTLVMANCPACA